MEPNLRKVFTITEKAIQPYSINLLRHMLNSTHKIGSPTQRFKPTGNIYLPRWLEFMFTMKCPAAWSLTWTIALLPIAQIYESILYVYGLWRRAVNTRPPPFAVQTWKHYIGKHIFGSLPWKTVNKFQTEKIWRDDMPLSEFNTTVTARSSTPLQHWPWYLVPSYQCVCKLLLCRF